MGTEMAVYRASGFTCMRLFTTTCEDLKKGISNHPKTCNEHCHLVSGKHNPTAVCHKVDHLLSDDSEDDEKSEAEGMKIASHCAFCKSD